MVTELYPKCLNIQFHTIFGGESFPVDEESKSHEDVDINLILRLLLHSTMTLTHVWF